MDSSSVVDASSFAFVPSERSIDLVRLARLTLGDERLQGEVLQSFGRQASMLIARMQQAARSGIGLAARALKDSAREIGAWRIAQAAEAVEMAAEYGGDPELKRAVDDLEVAADETRAVIAELLA